MNIQTEIEKLRHDPAHHLGMGDIRLTMGQQEEIIAEVKRLTFALERIRDMTMSHVMSYDHGFQRCREIAIDALANDQVEARRQ